jgi:GH15 family glucan-1,4-alpha-glucosidase
MRVKNLNLWPIGNCQVSALVDDQASFIWACQPQVDGDPLFCGLLDPKGEAETPRGEWRIALENQVSCDQHYLRNTPILISRLTDADGNAAEIYDFCPRFARQGRMYRPVAFVRIVRPVVGAPRIRVFLNPCTGWGAADAERTSGSNHVRFLTEPQPLRLTTDAPVGHILEGRSFRLEKSLHFFLGPDEPFVGNLTHTVATMLHQTSDEWRDWVRGLAIPLEWQKVVIRAAITLKLCQHEETGAIVAALTTSIPEAADSGALGLSLLAGSATLITTVPGAEPPRQRSTCWKITSPTCQHRRRIAGRLSFSGFYAVSGAPRLVEYESRGPGGYRGMGPVRVGNALIPKGDQHDAYGRSSCPTPGFFRRALYRKATPDNFKKPGRKSATRLRHTTSRRRLWDIRNRHFRPHIFLGDVRAACDRLENIAHMLGLEERAEHWHRRAVAVRQAIEQRAWHEPEKRFAATFGGDELDASLLQLVDMRFLEPSDPRFQATFDAVEKGLRRGEHMLRYAAEDDFGLPETAFNFCTFWLIEALHLVGRTEEARSLYEAMLGRLTPAGLLSEDTDFDTHELWGNYPQTYSLVGLINCAGLLSKPWSSIR